ncbi:regulator [candidate division KSB1 bacterium]|nr:regulator [candidate division KSB1 bacterium]
MKYLMLLYCFSSIFIYDAFGQIITDTPFKQEFHHPYQIGKSPVENDILAIAVDSTQGIWAASQAGAFLLAKNTKIWYQKLPVNQIGPVFDIAVDEKNTVWIGAWNGLYLYAKDKIQKIENITYPISKICVSKSHAAAFAPDGYWILSGKKWEFYPLKSAASIKDVLMDSAGTFWIATGMGLYYQTADSVQLFRHPPDLLSADVRALVYDNQQNLWIGGLGGISVYQNQQMKQYFTPENGLPTIFVQCLNRNHDGRMWIGTQKGLIKYDGKTWSLRHSRRWLMDDDVRDIAFDRNGTAWIATAKGVSAILQKPMTLAQKANHYLRICLNRHVRPPYLVEKCLLKTPGDTSSWQPRDDDNDGQYTSMYLAMESFRYAASKSAQAKENAQKAFAALHFLQTVTETPGFVARTVIPVTWKNMADPNEKISDADWAYRRIQDPREKRVENRWRLSKNGKWCWKGDTSSDEITGHMAGYLFYYDLVADSLEKITVRDHVCKIVDYIIDGGYVLKDIDGQHTRWGVWSPEKLNNDPNWAAERGINSVEILSYIKLAHHVSNNPRYHDEYIKLLYEHHYLQNVLEAKSLNPSWRTHIDDELLALAFPCLLIYEKDPAILQVYQQSIERLYTAVKDDQSPYFIFTYSLCTGKMQDLNAALAYLRDAPLDLINWRIDNSWREDLKLVHTPEFEQIQTNRLLPPSERGIIRWDNNPFAAVQGDGGHTESDGVWWLLPYWIGRYSGFITE